MIFTRGYVCEKFVLVVSTNVILLFFNHIEDLRVILSEILRVDFEIESGIVDVKHEIGLN